MTSGGKIRFLYSTIYIIMKKFTILSVISIAALLLTSCVERLHTDFEEDIPSAAPDINHFLTSKEFQVPVEDGCITTVTIGEDTLAEAIEPMSIYVPKTKSNLLKLTYTPKDEYPHEVILNNSKRYEVVCFEDSKDNDYDYNDLVIHVKYQQSGNIFGFGIHPVALGSSKSVKLGCIVYKGGYQIFKGLITPEGKNCREQFFQDQKGFINTSGTTINQQNGGWHGFLGSGIKNWDISKYPGDGAMRVEWYIVIENDIELYALSTAYLNQSFDKNNLPYGLIITHTGTQHYDEYNNVCGFDWFNYPQESKQLKNVYPEIWEWLTSDKTFDFEDIYSENPVPQDAYPASQLGLYLSQDVNVCDSKYRQN